MVVTDRNGKIVNQSRNLRGIRQYVGKNLIKDVKIKEIEQGRGYIEIYFDDGAYFQTVFASFNVLKDCVRRWRNVYGSKLWVNNKECGTISYHNSELY